MPTIEEMRQSMTNAGVYSKADIDKSKPKAPT